ncbi:hypothetical protein Zmor_021012 [Zophobas morio]|uniref:Uncharacterized protein n=1 Tax=Zophobas morio TaxID=2755281 RepID=A0AA38I8J0_9CUCU|nr:hypothetical protein Zmor_021012 [Zophobas morio]
MSSTQHVSRPRHVTARLARSRGVAGESSKWWIFNGDRGGACINLSREQRQVGVKAVPSLNQSRRTPYCCEGVVVPLSNPLDTRYDRFHCEAHSNRSEAATLRHVVTANLERGDGEMRRRFRAMFSFFAVAV